MKKIIALLSLTILFSFSAHALEQQNLDALIKQGMVVKMGELTGAGSRFSVHNLAGLILPEGVIMKEDCSDIILKNSVDPKISDIVKIKVDNLEISSSAFIGFVVK
ncbi:MAG: hypothetical protein Q7U04_07060 [Bacteriovorax sp.]|nr:hypothetical protein [Bacteriovorax sp.]